MKSESGTTTSLWMATADPGRDPPLVEDVRADVCIVGAGIAGLTTAYALARAGRSVVVIDDGPIAGGETCRTTAHLSDVIDDRFRFLERHHGAHGARLARESHGAAIDRIEAIAHEEGIRCDFERVDGYLFLGPGEDVEFLEQEKQAAVRAGLEGVEMLARAPLAHYTGPCLRFPRQAQFHPLRYLAGLARSIRMLGGRIHAGTHASEIEGGAPALVRTARGDIRAGAVVVATNTPVNDRVKIHTKLASYRTYAIAVRVPRGSVTRALYWDTSNPYHYLRLADAGAEDELLVVGGEDHKTGQAEDPAARHAALETWARERFPGAGEVAYRWSGQVIETVDGLAFIGRNPHDHANVFIAAGDSGMGMTHGTIAGMLLGDLVLERQNPWAKLYDPARKSLGNAGRFLEENLNVAAQYLRDFSSGGEVASKAEIPPGSGALLRRGLKKVAVYRAPGGTLHELSAICPHLGCVVHWNDLEKSWDCPCHGSRFDPKGKVIHGPATAGLAPHEDARRAG